jgi:outer membrane cobalamin receptor
VLHPGDLDSRGASLYIFGVVFTGTLLRITSPLLYYVSLCVLAVSIARSQADSVSTPAIPVDTTAHPPPLPPVFSIGADPSAALTNDQSVWFAPRYLGELLSTIPGVYVREQSSAGQYSQVNFRGSDWRGAGVLVDGRPMNDPATGIYNLYHFSLDNAEQVEAVPGIRSFLYGLNTAGGAINLVTRQFDSNRPFSRLVFSEGVYEYSFLDGTFSQNVSRPLNITFGFQHQSTAGRYSNSEHDAWNARARIRYRIADQLALILSWYYTSTKTQLNGGLEPSAAGLPSAFFPLETSVRNDDAYEKITRNDVDVALAGFFFDDSLSPTRLSFYYSNNFREYRDETGGAVPNNVFLQSNHTSSWMGSLFTQRLESSFHRFDLGANLEIRQIEGSPNLGRRRNVIGSVYAKEELFLLDRLSLSGYGRYDRYLNGDYSGFGADAHIDLAWGISAFGGGSRSPRLPNYAELYWTDSTVTRVEPLIEETHRQMEFGLEYKGDAVRLLRAAYFRRNVEHPIHALPGGQDYVFPEVTFVNGTETTTEGVEVRADIRIWRIALEGSGTFMRQESDMVQNLYPEFWFDGGIYFEGGILEDNLTLKTGFRGYYQTEHLGTEFNAELPVYVSNVHQRLGAGGSVDFVLIARIGDAHVHFVWENLTETRYFTSPYYPALDRSIRFGITWNFLD